MLKRVMKRFSSLMLAALLLLSIMPAISLPALAATSGTISGLSDTNIGLSFGSTSGNAAEDPWSADGTTISGSVVSVGGYSTTNHYNSTLTITNNKTIAATLSFDYTVALNSGTIQVDGTGVTENGSFSKELAAGASINVYLLSGDTTPTTISMANVKLVSAVTATPTFQPAVNGSYTVDGAAITKETSFTQSSTQGYAVVATPASGYQFMGWYDVAREEYISAEATTTLNMEYDATITARFAPVGVALFEVGGQIYEDLNDATAYATANSITKVTLVSDGTLSGSYTIPAGVILLIPFDENKTLYTDTPTALSGDGGNRIAYRTLTLAEGASLTVNGGISVGGRYKCASGNASGGMTGAYGLISMESGSRITVKSGGTLYAWGFVTGSGNVTVESGGTVYEWYQIADFRGGTATLPFIFGNKKVFPFSQYFVQNVEAPMTINAGAMETVYTGVYASSQINNASITFIGEGGMFNLTSGSVTKEYDGSTDRLMLTINGEMELNSLSLNLGGINVSSAKYVLPITNNISLEIASGSLTVNQTTSLLAGVDVTVCRDAELVISEGYSVYLYDRDEWTADDYVKGGKFKSVVYAPGKTYNRTEADLVDARINVLGTMIAAGAVYTTAGGANICSDGAGVYQQAGAPGTERVTYQYTQSGSNVTAHQIPITPAKLHNADGSYFETAGAAAGDFIVYTNGFWHNNGTEPPVTNYHIIFRNYDGTTLYEVDVAEGEIPVYEGATPEKPADAQYTYTFSHWSPDVVAATCDATYTAVFSENANSYTITYNVNGEFYAEQTYEYGAAVTAPEYTVPEGHTFSGWNVPETMPAENLVLNATLTVNSYTITYNVNGEFYAEQTYEYGAAVTAPEYTVPEGHTFSGWNVPETMPAENLVLNATLTVNSYTITYNVNGVFYAEQTYEYGAAVTAPEYTVPEGHTFSGWNVPETMPAENLVLNATLTVNSYTITYNVNGEFYAEQTYEYGAAVTAPEYTVPEGHTFSGWNVPETMPAENLVLNATLTVNSYTITYNVNDEFYAEQTYDYGAAVTAPEYTVPEGHTFSGWNVPETMPAENLVLNATLTVNSYTITYNVNGVFYATQTYDYGAAVTAPEYTVPEGHTFSGWNVPETMPAENLVLNATLTVNRYTITYNVNGEFYAEQTYEYGAAVTAPEYTVPEGHTFSGWNVPETMPAENLVLNAALTVNSYTITYNVNGVFYATQTYDYGAAVTAPEYTVPEGHTFSGWNVPETMPAENLVLNATLTVNSYTITYNVNGEFYAAQTYEYGAAVTAPEYTVPEGHTFSGWNVPETMPAESLVLNATLTVNSYTITYNVNGVFYAEQTYEYGAAVTAPEYTCEYTYYHFSGWAVPDTMPAHDASYNAVMTPYDGIEWYADELYLFDNGEMVEFPGLVRVVTDDDVKYYYFGEENFAARARMIDGEFVTEYMVERNNGLLFAGDNYIFGEDGVIEHLDYTLNGIKEVDGKLYYLIDGVIIRHGLVEVDGSFYYCRSTSGELVRNTRYWITRTNGLTWADGTPIEAGYYFFDEEAKLSDKNGIIAENGSLYYYVHGSLTPAGLIELDGDYYYVRTSNCEVIHGRSYWITVTNGLMPIGLYEFGEDGRMLNPPEVQPGEEEPEIKNGIVAEFGSLYYYVDGVLTPAGLIELDGEYYYVRTSNCEVVHGCSYWITVTNDLMPAGMYTFADDGKLIH